MISVCMTTYNGEKYLKAQLSSILSQLSYDDECLISDDGSTDHTIAIIQEFQNKYPQIRLLQGPRKGVIANFNYCISQSKGDFIFLADQDDVWHADKVEKILALFQLQPQTKLILSDLAIVDSDLKLVHASYFKYKKVKTSGKSATFGSAIIPINISCIGTCLGMGRISCFKSARKAIPAPI